LNGQAQRKAAVPFEGPQTLSVTEMAQAILARDTPATIDVPGLDKRDADSIFAGLARWDDETPRDKQHDWMLFCNRDPDYLEADDGVIRKNATDQKIFLHWRPSTENLLLSMSGIALEPWQKDWFAACERMHAACVARLLSIAEAMDAEWQGCRFADRVRAGARQHVLRALKYEPKVEKQAVAAKRADEFARTHTDRCGITFHIAESCDGLYAMRGREKRRFSTAETPNVLCFSGLQLEKITLGAVPALYHGVDDRTDGSERRFALVFFGKLPKDAGTY
jgi:isopenicillin N synthase-like dioxygenase